MRLSIILIGLGLVLGLPTNVQAVDPDIKCSAAKVKEAAKYSACRQIQRLPAEGGVKSHQEGRGARFHEVRQQVQREVAEGGEQGWWRVSHGKRRGRDPSSSAAVRGRPRIQLGGVRGSRWSGSRWSLLVSRRTGCELRCDMRQCRTQLRSRNSDICGKRWDFHPMRRGAGRTGKRSSSEC